MQPSVKAELPSEDIPVFKHVSCVAPDCDGALNLPIARERSPHVSAFSQGLATELSRK